MPSSLAAALAASKAKNEPAAAPQQQQQSAHAKSPGPSSLAQYQKKQTHSNKSAETHSHAQKAHHNKDALKKQIDGVNNGKGQDKQQASKGRSPQKQKNNDVAAEEIVFVCDIPSDSDEEDIDFDTLQISSARSGGRGGRCGRNNSNQRHERVRGGRDNNNSNGGRLNVNASRRLIGHALGKRIDAPQNTSRETNNSGNNDRAPSSSHPGAMPTPWSKKAQEMKQQNNVNNSRNTRQANSRWEKDAPRDRQRNNGDIPSQTFGKNNTPPVSVQTEVAEPAPKLESAKIKGRWADEDSSDDE